MLAHPIRWPRFIWFCAIACFGLASVSAQTSIPDFYKNLPGKALFVDADLAALGQGQTIVKLLPASDKREVAVAGLVGLQAPAEVFMQSFRESMLRKSNPAILEVGRFGSTPTLDDLRTLTFEDRDLDDLKNCIVGDCKIKLSGAMIELLQKEIDWNAPDYRLQATQLLKRMLVDYMRDYVARGEAALITYRDKQNEVRLADEQRALMAGSIAVPEFAGFPTGSNSGSRLRVVEDSLVWSKIKFGLKPVFAINHITIYKREQKVGPQVVIVSKQIYANHYFDSSLALTVFENNPNVASSGYLFYENRSRADGLQGPFGGIKRGIVENKAIASLTAILEQSRADLNARALHQADSVPAPHARGGWKRWTVRGLYLLSWLAIVALFIGFLTVRNNFWKGTFSGTAPRHT